MSETEEIYYEEIGGQDVYAVFAPNHGMYSYIHKGAPQFFDFGAGQTRQTKMYRTKKEAQAIVNKLKNSYNIESTIVYGVITFHEMKDNSKRLVSLFA